MAARDLGSNLRLFAGIGSHRYPSRAMRFWPFGSKEKEPEESSDLDFASRVVTGPSQDGSVLRAKVTVHFQEPRTAGAAEPIVERASQWLRACFYASDSGQELVGTEPELGREATRELVAELPAIRSVDVVALHVLSESPTPAPPSVGPPSVIAPSSHPPSAASAAKPSSRPPPMQSPPRRSSSSSSQMLAVRDSRLIPEGATVDAAAFAIVPLLRDAATRVLIGVLRACDLVIVRGLRLDTTSADNMGELVPQSTAAAGRFAEERRDELLRWEERLGEDKVGALRTEAAAVVCYFLHTSLQQVGVETSAATALLDAAARAAFDEEGALSSMPYYLGSASDPTDALARKALLIVADDSDAFASFTVMLSPVLASLHEDFAFTSGQIKISMHG